MSLCLLAIGIFAVSFTVRGNPPPVLKSHEEQIEVLVNAVESIDLVHYYDVHCSTQLLGHKILNETDYLIRQSTHASAKEWINYIQSRNPTSAIEYKFKDVTLSCDEEEKVRFRDLSSSSMVEAISTFRSSDATLIRFPEKLPAMTMESATEIVKQKLNEWQYLPLAEVEDLALALSGQSYHYGYLRSNHMSPDAWDELKAAKFYAYLFEQTGLPRYVYNRAFNMLSSAPDTAKSLMQLASEAGEPRATVWLRSQQACTGVNAPNDYLGLLDSLAQSSNLDQDIIESYKRLFSIGIDNHGCHRQDLKFVPFAPLDFLYQSRP